MNAPAAESDSAQSTRPLSRPDIASVLALAVSVFALALGAWQTRLMQSQARASVWPFLSIGYSYTSNVDPDSFIWQIDNNGVGPAKIQSVEVKLDGKPYRNWKELFAVLAPDQEFHAQTSSLNGLVLPPSLNRETTIEMVKPDTPERAKVFLTAQQRISIEVCYRSVYDECWIAQSLKPGNTSVPRCERTGKLQFED